MGCLVLKPLDQALKDNDKIRCIVSNTGTNQDGRTVGSYNIRTSFPQLAPLTEDKVFRLQVAKHKRH